MLEKNGYEPGRDFLRDICEPADYDDYKKSWFAIKIDGVCIGIYNTDIEDEIQIGDPTYTGQDEKIPVEIEATEAPYCYELKGDDLHEIDLTKIQGKIEKKLNELAQTGISFSDKIADKAVRKVAVRRVVGVARREAEELKVDSQEREAK